MIVSILTNIVAGFIGGWLMSKAISVYSAYRERKRQEAFNAQVSELTGRVRDLKEEMDALEQRFKNGPCGDGLCSTGNGNTFDCVAATKDIEAKLDALYEARAAAA